MIVSIRTPPKIQVGLSRHLTILVYIMTCSCRLLNWTKHS